MNFKQDGTALNKLILTLCMRGNKKYQKYPLMLLTGHLYATLVLLTKMTCSTKHVDEEVQQQSSSVQSHTIN